MFYDLTICQECGKPTLPHAGYCQVCGSPLPERLVRIAPESPDAKTQLVKRLEERALKLAA